MMKKQYLIVAISFFIFACGGNAENVSIENEQETPVLVEEKTSHLDEKELLAQTEIKIKESTEVNEKIEAKEPVVDQKEIEDETVDEIIETAEKVLPTVTEIRANHEVWNDLTKKYVTPAGKVNYNLMKANISKIKAYLSHLEKTSPQTNWSKNEKLAYWINLYNASTVYLVASNYPVSSITKINGGKPWDKKFVKSGAKVYSLNDIENNIVRPKFKDPRIHAALNCAAVSCSKLLNGAYLSESLDAQLDKQVRAWVNDSSKNKLNGNKVQISQIFDWYKVDFKGGVVPFLNKYLSTSVAVQSNAKISYLEYNWVLNE